MVKKVRGNPSPDGSRLANPDRDNATEGLVRTGKDFPQHLILRLRFRTWTYPPDTLSHFLTRLPEASGVGLVGAPECTLRPRGDPPSADTHPHQEGYFEDLVVAGPESASLEAAHHAIDLLAEKHRLAAEAANRAR
jgi:hypothetical protein